MKYFLYARKSEEDAKRQIASIPRQLKQLTEKFPQCEIIDTFTEELTAAKPGRPEFNKMVARIERGEAQGILVWTLNRLLRNEVDYGKIGWLLRSKALRSVLTMEKEYTPKDSVIIMAVDAGVSTQFVKDVEEHTTAAVSEKMKQGWAPHRAPEGYLNDVTKPQGLRDIYADPVRFPLIRKGWDMLLTGSYGVYDVLRYLNKAGYRVRPHERNSTGRLSKSALYRMFANPFYMGMFRHNGQVYQGRHTRMVTPEEFNRVQVLLGNRTVVRSKNHCFAYGGRFNCGRCGCRVCGDLRQRKLASGEVRPHMYYGCTNGKGGCSRKTTVESSLDDQFSSLLKSISVEYCYRDLLIEIWRDYYDQHVRGEEISTASQKNDLEKKRIERNRLLDLRLQELIDDSMFREKKAELDQQIVHLEQAVEGGTMAIERMVEDTEHVLLFMTEPKDRFRNLPPEDKRSVLEHLGSSYSLTDGIVGLELNKMLVPAQQHAGRFNLECATFSRRVFRSESTKKAAYNRLCLAWGPVWDAIRTTAVENSLWFPDISMMSPGD